ncbi:MAG: hypothetical protein ACYS8W_11485 [Planctomycetota bacterium]
MKKWSRSVFALALFALALTAVNCSSGGGGDNIVQATGTGTGPGGGDTYNINDYLNLADANYWHFTSTGTDVAIWQMSDASGFPITADYGLLLHDNQTKSRCDLYSASGGDYLMPGWFEVSTVETTYSFEPALRCGLASMTVGQTWTDVGTFTNLSDMNAQSYTCNWQFVGLATVTYWGGAVISDACIEITQELIVGSATRNYTHYYLLGCGRVGYIEGTTVYRLVETNVF